MKRPISLFLFISASISLLFYSCKKEEGFGGKATIKGTLIERVYDPDFTTLQSQSAATDEDIFIEFGNSGTIGDDAKTSASGKFEFKYLQPGKYYIYYYSEDSTNHRNNNTPIIKEVNISKDDETVDLGNLISYKTIDFDEGNATVKGVIGEVHYVKNFAYINGVGYAKDHDVFIFYNSRPNSELKTSTIYNGTYMFNNLIKGNYTLYTLSENKDNSGIDIVIKKEFSITDDNQIVQIDSISVDKER